jgi:hypothetical protein
MRPPPDIAERRPRAESGAPNDARGDGTRASVTDLAARRHRRAWARTILHLHDHGLPAAVPEDLAAWLRRRGITADWFYRNPCHGCEGCWVLTAEGGNPPPEIHVCPRRTGAS